MSYFKSIFDKANVRGFADYLLFGLVSNQDNRDYETRLEDVYQKYEKAVLQFDQNLASELLDLANDVTSETASVYTEIGMQAGILFMRDIIKNLIIDEPIQSGKETGTDNKSANIITDIINNIGKKTSIIDILYKERMDAVIEKKLKSDKRYQDLETKAYKKINQIEKLQLNSEQWKTVDEPLSLNTGISFFLKLRNIFNKALDN